jgi:hypothetical protein
LCPGSALANGRVQTNATGQVVLKLKTAWRDGTTHLAMSPLEFMQRLPALTLPDAPVDVQHPQALQPWALRPAADTHRA